MMKKILLLPLLAAALLLGGCSQQAAPETVPEETKPVVLDMVTCYGVDDGNRREFENAIRSYEEISGNRVWDRSSVSNEDWKNLVLTDFMTGSEPDVLFYFTNADADPFVNAGRVVSIEEIRAVYPDYATNLRESMFSQAADGKHYAVPSSGYWESLFVNRRVLEDCDIPVPGPDYTWEQFLEDCEVIKSKGYTPIAGSLGEIPHYWFEFLVMNNGSVFDHQNIPALDGEGKLLMDETAEKWIAALEDLKDLYEKGYFPENTLTAADVETVAMFAQGQAAFLVDGSWKVGYLSEHYPEHLRDFTVSFFPGKGNREAAHAVGGISMGYFITRKAWNDPNKQKAAVELVFHMTSEEVLKSFVSTEITALTEYTPPAGVNILQKSASEAFAQVTELSPAVQDSISSDAKRELFASVPNVVTGRVTAEQAVEAAIKLN